MIGFINSQKVKNKDGSMTNHKSIPPKHQTKHDRYIMTSANTKA